MYRARICPCVQSRRRFGVDNQSLMCRASPCLKRIVYVLGCSLAISLHIYIEETHWKDKDHIESVLAQNCELRNVHFSNLIERDTSYPSCTLHDLSWAASMIEWKPKVPASSLSRVELLNPPHKTRLIGPLSALLLTSGLPQSYPITHTAE